VVRTSSLTDDNFHRIIDDVRRIRGIARAEGELGTVLMLFPDPVREVLWQRDLRLVSMMSREEMEVAKKEARTRSARPLSDQEGRKLAEKQLTPEAARRLEILLDQVAFLARGSHHLLEGQRFDALLTVGEKHLSKALQEVVRQLNVAEVRDSVMIGRPREGGSGFI
jgi:hypothetical protein